MRRVGQARKRDANEMPIRKALEACGHAVTPVSGKGAPDLLVRVKGRSDGLCHGLEIKSAKGKQTEAQEVTDWPIVRTPEEALLIIGAIR